jgi:hypothetical protein
LFSCDIYTPREYIIVCGRLEEDQIYEMR